MALFRGIVWAVMIWATLFIAAGFISKAAADTGEQDVTVTREAGLGDSRTQQSSEPFDPFPSLERMRQAEVNARRTYDTMETMRQRWPWVPEEIQRFILKIANKSHPTPDELQAAWLIGELATSLAEAEKRLRERGLE